MNELKFTGYI